MKDILKLLAIGVAIAAPTTFAHANPIIGSDSINFNEVTVTPSGSLDPISAITSINFGIPGDVSSTGTGDLSGVPPVVTAVTFNESLFPGGVDGGTGGVAFSFTIAGYGTFTETENPVVNTNGMPSSGSSNVDLYLYGTFTPSFGGFSAGPASLDVSFTQTSGSYSGSGTFASPAAGDLTATPEPNSLILLGTGLVGTAGTFYRRRRIKA